MDAPSQLEVQASNEPPYMVRISFDPFARRQWESLLAEVRDRKALASSISSGDLPLELQTAFSKANLRFMPERYVDLHLECACPDWLKPCKHLVAVWLKFARDFDRDPFLVFELRGLKRDDLLALLRNRQPAAVREPEETDAAEEFPEVAVPLELEALLADPRSLLVSARTSRPASRIARAAASGRRHFRETAELAWNRVPVPPDLRLGLRISQSPLFRSGMEWPTEKK